MKIYRFNIWMEKFRIIVLKEDKIVESKKSEILQVVTDMSQFAGALSGAAVVAGKKVICYLILERPDDSGHDF